MDYLTTHTSLSPIRRGFEPGFVNYNKGCTRLAAASDKVYQFLAHGQWFSPCTPASSTTKTGRHDIAEILLKVALNTKNQSINPRLFVCQSRPEIILPTTSNGNASIGEIITYFPPFKGEHNYYSTQFKYEANESTILKSL